MIGKLQANKNITIKFLDERPDFTITPLDYSDQGVQYLVSAPGDGTRLIEMIPWHTIQLVQQTQAEPFPV